ncbi:MAG: response regulator [Legionellaceae bacterium]|nr:response regulator [Legionellaceae bacterium]
MRPLRIKHHLLLWSVAPIVLFSTFLCVWYNIISYQHDVSDLKALSSLTQKNIISRPQLHKLSKESQQLLGSFSTLHHSQALEIICYRRILFSIVLISFSLLTGLITYFLLTRKLYVPLLRLSRSMRLIMRNVLDTPIVAQSVGELGLIEQGCIHLQKQYALLVDDAQHQVEVATQDLQLTLESLEEKNIQLELDKKKIEEKARLKSEFIANMSHEIRTPMNAVMGFTNILLESKLDPLQRDYVKTIQSSSQDLLRIINEVLDYSKIEAGKLLLDHIPFDIRNNIDEITALAAPSAHQKGLDLIASTDLAVPTMMLGDPLRIKQILNNLVNNAIKFTSEGIVLISTSIEQETERHYLLKIMVQDTGIGLTEEEQSILFTAFQQADTSITRRFGGSGLGLTICKKLAEAMDGSIQVTSRRNEGTIFSVQLTLQKMAMYELEKHRHHDKFNGIQVLYFESNPLYRDALSNGLGYWGINCTPMETLQELEEAILKRSHEYAMAFVGLEANHHQQIPQILRKAPIPIIFIAKHVIQEPEALGGQGFMNKPVSIQKLYDTVQFFLDKTRQTAPAYQELQALRKQVADQKLRILIAEDNTVSRMLLVSFLTPHTQVQAAQDGKEVIELAKSNAFDVIILDLQMPEYHGIAAASRIRQPNSLNQHTPIFLISANSSDIRREDLTEYGITQCLQKPIDEKLLLKTILDIYQKQSLIHWDLCVEKASGKPELAKELLGYLISDLQEQKQQLKILLEEEDFFSIETIAHTIRGACAFIGIPSIQTLATHLEEACQAIDPSANRAQLTQALLQHIELLIQDYYSHPELGNVEMVEAIV